MSRSIKKKLRNNTVFFVLQSHTNSKHLGTRVTEGRRYYYQPIHTCEYYFHCNFVKSVDQSHHFFPDWISTIGWTAMKLHPVIHCWQKMNPFDFGDHLTTMWLMFLKYRWATWRLEIVNDLQIVEIAVFKVLLLLFSNSLTSRSVLRTTAIEWRSQLDENADVLRMDLPWVTYEYYNVNYS